MLNLTELNTSLQDIPAPDAKHEDWRFVDRKNQREVLQPTFSWQSYATPSCTLQDGALHVQQLPENVSICTNPDIDDWVSEQINTGDYAARWSCTADAGCTQLTIEATTDTPLVIHHTGGNGRLLIDVRENVQAEIILINDIQEKACTGFDLVVAPHSRVTVDEIDTASGTQLYTHKTIRVAGDAEVIWNSISLGGALVRHAAIVELLNPHAHCTLRNGFSLQGNAQAHSFVRLYHRSPQTSCQQLFKTVADDESLTSFDGLVHMDEGADESEAQQRNANLQLSDDARVYSMPQLDIFTDDVIANHGSSIGQPDGEELWYLRSRGLSLKQARQLVIGGFVTEIAHSFSTDAGRTLALALLG